MTNKNLVLVYFFCCLMLASSTWLLCLVDNGTNFDWLRSCDISTCDFSPDENPEKYGRPMKSAINKFESTNRLDHMIWCRV